MVYTIDSKSIGGNSVRVQVPSPVSNFIRAKALIPCCGYVLRRDWCFTQRRRLLKGGIRGFEPKPSKIFTGKAAILPSGSIKPQNGQ